MEELIAEQPATIEEQLWLHALMPQLGQPLCRGPLTLFRDERIWSLAGFDSDILFLMLGFWVCHDILKEFEGCLTYLETLPMDYLEQGPNAVMDQF